MNGLGVPDVAVVVADGAVGGEETRAGGVQDRHPGPPVLVGPGGCDGLVVAVDVGPVVGQDQVFVPVQDGGEDLLGGVVVGAGEGTGGEGVDGGLELGVAFAGGARGVPVVPEGGGLGGGEAEQEEAVRPNRKKLPVPTRPRTISAGTQRARSPPGSSSTASVCP